MFKQDNAAPATTAANNTRGNFEPAIGFVNLYLPSRDGRRVKLGAVPLKASNEREKALFDALSNKENSEAVIAAVLSKLVMDFQPVTTGEGNLFDLGV
jgi:hypothetical protein